MPLDTLASSEIRERKKKWFKKLPSQNWSWLPWCLSLFRLKKIVFTSYYVYGGSDTGWQFMELSLDIFYDLIIYDEAILYKVYNHRVYQFIITLCWHIWFLIWNPLSTKANIYVYKHMCVSTSSNQSIKKNNNII